MRLGWGDDTLLSIGTAGSQGPGGLYIKIPGVCVTLSAHRGSASLSTTSRGTLDSSCLWGPRSVQAVVVPTGLVGGVGIGVSV